MCFSQYNDIEENIVDFPNFQSRNVFFSILCDMDRVSFGNLLFTWRLWGRSSQAISGLGAEERKMQKVVVEWSCSISVVELP